MTHSAFRNSCLAVLVCVALVACKSTEERAAEHYENGLRLIEEGDPQRAMVEFLNTLNLTADNIEARRKIAEVQEELGRYNASYRSYLQLVERAPDDLEARVKLAKMAFTSRNWEEFERHGRSAVELAPEDLEVKAINIGLNYRQATLDEDVAARSTILQEAETLARALPDSDIIRRIRIDGYVGKQDYRAALALIDESIAETPDDLTLYNSKLQFLAQLGEQAALEAELRTMIDVFPDNIAPKQTLLRYLLGQERTDDAEALLEEFFAKAETREERNQTFVNIIQFLQTIRGPEAALARLEASLEEEPDNDAWRVLLATLRFEGGEQDRGIAALEAVLSKEESTLSDTERQNTKIALAEMLVTTGNEVGARRQVEEVLQADPSSAPALKMQAVWLIQEDKTTEAITALRTALENASEDADAMILMAQAYERAGDRALTEDFLSLAVDASNNAPRYALIYANFLNADEKFVQAEQILISSLRTAPNNMSILQALGSIYLRLEDLPRAQRVAQTLENLEDPNAVAAANALNASIMARQAGADQALDFLQQLAEEEGAENITARLNLIQGQLQAGQTDEAITLARALVAENPEDLRRRNALAQAHLVAQDLEAAEAEYNAILEQRPDLSSIWVRLARIKAAQGDQETARSIIDEGLEKAPGALDLLWGKASFLQTAGDIDGAIEIYESMYEQMSNSPVIANNLASLLSTHRADEASLDRARTISRRLRGTDVPAFQDTYGWILYQSGDVDGALPYLESAAQGLPDDARVQYHLGAAYAAAGRTEEAQAQLSQALATVGTLGDQSVAALIRQELTALEAAPE
ncbi:tetratricopeptide repeat protein [Roseobacter weihaiensis]|uniref:tetratricopeptide repeat protein n=1 Tax=Roseobacter weihaiensis TaxID=2763262 RepID=UPI001D0AC2E5|nr:tetratricopeptide repeat protein [Roseobacter sp. H9]